MSTVAITSSIRSGPDQQSSRGELLLIGEANPARITWASVAVSPSVPLAHHCLNCLKEYCALQSFFCSAHFLVARRPIHIIDKARIHSRDSSRHQHRSYSRHSRHTSKARQRRRQRLRQLQRRVPSQDANRNGRNRNPNARLELPNRGAQLPRNGRDACRRREIRIRDAQQTHAHSRGAPYHLRGTHRVRLSPAVFLTKRRLL